MASRPARADFYFDYVSGYAYLAWWSVKRVCAERRVTLRPRPVLLAALLDHWGQLGPAEIPPKASYVLRDWVRTARLLGLELRGPRTHPFNPLLALRLSLREVAGAEQARVVDALFRAGWAQGIDLACEEEVAAALEAEGLDAEQLVARTRDPVVKQALRAATDAAIARGVFGVPTMVAGRELLWGHDRVEHLALVLDGRDPLDDPAARALIARRRPRAAERRRRRRTPGR